ncbi:MAG TPA: UrcA family protein [Caulobacteraceae bacterium]
MIVKTLSILAAAASLAAVGAAHAQTYQGDDSAYQGGGSYQGDSYSPGAPSSEDVIVTAPRTYGNREIKSAPVYFDDLDLNSPEGGYTLLTRIRAAATQVCSPVADMRGDLRDTGDFQHCVRRAVAHAVNEVGAPSVQDAYYQLGVGSADLPAG